MSGSWISQETDGEPTGGTRQLEDATADIYVSTYVLDLLSEADVRETLREARRLLRPGTGRLLLAGITYGDSVSSHAACALWQLVRSLSLLLRSAHRQAVVYTESGGDRDTPRALRLFTVSVLM